MLEQVHFGSSKFPFFQSAYKQKFVAKRIDMVTFIPYIHDILKL